MAHIWNLASDCEAFHILNVEIRDYAILNIIIR